MKNALTVDLEDWYHVCGVEEYADSSRWDSYESRIIRNTDRVLRILDTFDVKATFFVLGYIASREPGLIRDIQSRGHEIATHGYYHRRIFELTREEFEYDIRKSIDVISSVTDRPVLGFRAPEWSVRPSTPWMLSTLRKHGIVYDSSMVPLTRMGDRKFPLYPVMFDTEYGTIWEFPLTTMRLFWEHIPFSGGLPLRIAPYFYIVSKIHRMNGEGHPCVVYIHPWEFDMDRPRVDLPLSRRFMHYFNIRVTERKVTGLLRYLKFAPIGELLDVSEG